MTIFLSEKLHEVGNFRNESSFLENNGRLRSVQIDHIRDQWSWEQASVSSTLTPYNPETVIEKLYALSRVAEPGLKISFSGHNSKAFANAVT